MVKPPSINHAESVERSDGRLREKSIQNVSNNTTNGMRGEDIKRIIVAAEEFELGRKIADRSSKDTK